MSTRPRNLEELAVAIEEYEKTIALVTTDFYNKTLLIPVGIDFIERDSNKNIINVAARFSAKSFNLFHPENRELLEELSQDEGQQLTNSEIKNV